MSAKIVGREWFDRKIKPLIAESFELKYINERGGDLGDLFGVQFDSLKRGGYVYFWSSGYVGFQLVDYEKEIEVVEDTTENIACRPLEEVFEDLLMNLGEDD